jgi:hypothetical protein
MRPGVVGWRQARSTCSASDSGAGSYPDYCCQPSASITRAGAILAPQPRFALFVTLLASRAPHLIHFGLPRFVVVSSRGAGLLDWRTCCTSFALFSSPTPPCRKGAYLPSSAAWPARQRNTNPHLQKNLGESSTPPQRYLIVLVRAPVPQKP